MLLAELKPEILDEEFSKTGKPFGPTDVFHKFYGNYCGPGNRGGDPIDAVDDACRCHDMCYHYKGRNHPECDKNFIYKLDHLLKSQLTFKQRTAAMLMKSYFTRTLTNKLAKDNSKPEANS